MLNRSTPRRTGLFACANATPLADVTVNCRLVMFSILPRAEQSRQPGDPAARDRHSIARNGRPLSAAAAIPRNRTCAMAFGPLWLFGSNRKSAAKPEATPRHYAA